MLGHLGDLTRGRLLARNVVANLAGWLLPAVIALAAVPVLIRALDPSRYGILALTWTLVGYFGVFDLGLGRALTQLISERAGTDAERETPALTWAAMSALALLGIVGAVALAAGAPALVARWRDLPDALRAEAVLTLRLLAVAVPCLVVTSGLRAILEAAQEFRVINVLRVPLALLNFLGPVAVLPFSRALPAVVGTLVAGRVLVCALHVWVVWRRFPALHRPHPPTARAMRALAHVAGWMTVSAVVSPIMVSVDRLVIAAALPVAAVGHYATASEVATKLWLVTAAIQPVLFPALAATIARAPARAAELFDLSARLTVLALLPVAVVLVLFARDGLALWAGAGVATVAAPVLQGLTIAVFVNAVGQTAYAGLQAGGHASVAARLHLVELPLYLGALYALVARYGIAGVAVAWGLRMLVDTLLQLWLVGRAMPALGTVSVRAVRMVVPAAALLVCCIPLAAVPGRGLVAAALVALIAAAGWMRLVLPEERARVAAVLRRDVARAEGEAAS